MFDDRLAFMRYLALEAGSILLSARDAGFSSGLKADSSVVTTADLAVSEFIQIQLNARYPGEGILNEEVCETEQDTLERMAKRGVWIIDPLDGSRDFSKGESDYCFLAAYAVDGVPTHGVIYEPHKSRMFLAQKGEGAYLMHGTSVTRIGPMQPVQWDTALVGHPKNYSGDKYAQLYYLLGIPDERLVRSGSIGTRMAQVALDETQLILGYSRNLHEWDIAAGHVVLEERGVKVTDIFGKPLCYNKEVPTTPNGVLVAHPDLHHEAVEKLAFALTRLEM